MLASQIGGNIYTHPALNPLPEAYQNCSVPLLTLTAIPGFLDSLGQLLVLLHTDSCGKKKVTQ